MKLIYIFIFTTFSLAMSAQEMDFDVRITTPKLQTVDPKVFETLELALKEFLNNQKWTDEEYDLKERIKCNLQMTITNELTPTSFEAEIALQATRPVYGSNYETALISHVDKDLKFSYEQGLPLLYSDNAFNDNLTAVLSFYVYVILGLDHDTYELEGGKQYIAKAQEIINQIPASAKEKGWKLSDGDRNRYWIAENLQSNRVTSMRQALYNYHRHGLDVMHKDPAKGREVMKNAIKTISDVSRKYPNSMIVQMFSNAKSAEIIEIFKGAPREEKNSVYQMMKKIDPTKNAEFRSIVR